MSTSNNEEPVTRDGLKAMSLTQQVAKLASNYEDQIAELRVDLTIVSQERDYYKKLVDDAGLLEEPDTASAD